MLKIFENKAASAPENKGDTETLRTRLGALRRSEATFQRKLDEARQRARLASAAVSEGEDNFILEAISAEELAKTWAEATAAVENVQAAEQQVESHRGLMRRFSELLTEAEQQEKSMIGGELLSKHREIRKRHAVALLAVIKTNEELAAVELDMRQRCPRAEHDLIHKIPGTAGAFHRIHSIFDISLSEGPSIGRKWLEAVRAVAPDDLPDEVGEFLDGLDRAANTAEQARRAQVAARNAEADIRREKTAEAQFRAVYGG